MNENEPNLPARETPLGEEAGVPPLLERLEGVIFRPTATMRALEPRWGWLGPWLVVLAAGLIHALASVTFVDHRTIGARRADYAFDQMPEQTRRLVAMTPEARDQAARWSGFQSRVLPFAGAIVGSIVRITALGLVLFGAASLLGGERNLLKAIVVSAHAKLVAVAGYGAWTIAILVGNPEPRTSPANLVDEMANPLAFAFLDGFDPIALWHVGLVAIGLAVALAVPRRRAVLVASGIHLVPWLLGLAAAGVSVAMKGK